jgi:hypothetical protein
MLNNIPGINKNSGRRFGSHPIGNTYNKRHFWREIRIPKEC